MPHLLGGREIPEDYNKIFYHEDTDARISKLEMWTYPTRQWGVEVIIPGQMIVLTCPSLSLTHGYHLPMNDDNIAKLCERAVIACGEILERHGISRDRKFNPDKLETLLRDPLGDVITPDALDTVDPIKK